MRERECFRDQLQSLRERYEGREAIGIEEACNLLGLGREVLINDRTFPLKQVGKKYIICLVPLARWMVGGGTL